MILHVDQMVVYNDGLYDKPKTQGAIHIFQGVAKPGLEVGEFMNKSFAWPLPHAVVDFLVGMSPVG